MKRTLFCVLTVLFALSLAACGASPDSGDQEEDRKIETARELSTITPEIFIEDVSARLSESGYTPLSELTFEKTPSSDGGAETYVYTLFSGATYCIEPTLEGNGIRRITMDGPTLVKKKQSNLFSHYMLETVAEFTNIRDDAYTMLQKLNDDALSEFGVTFYHKAEHVNYSMVYDEDHVQFIAEIVAEEGE